MRINYKHPKYVIPVILIPFLCTFFFVYKGTLGKDTPVKEKGGATLQDGLAEVSDQIKEGTLADKLEAYQKSYKDGDGYTAVGEIGADQQQLQQMPDLYNSREKHKLDSIEQALKRQYSSNSYNSSGENGIRNGGYTLGTNPGFPSVRSPYQNGYPDDTDRQLALAMMRLKDGQHQAPVNTAPQPDPMEMFRKQMNLIDSMGKANDPELKAEKEKQQQIALAETETKSQKKLSVSKINATASLFNTITAKENQTFITAIVDQDITGYSGSRLRIRLLDDMMAGKFLIKKGSYLYAQVSGFSGQRVSLTVSTIMQENHILPVRLELYDTDGLPGLFVPASAFREFSKELGANTGQGITIQQQAENNNQLVMGMLQRMFQSTTTAVTKLIRSNKAHLKYNTLIYLIDPDELKNNQRNY